MLSDNAPSPRKKAILSFLFVLLVLTFSLMARYFWGYDNFSRIVRESITSTLIVLCLMSFLGRKWVIGYLTIIFVLAFGYGVVGFTYGLPDQNAIAALLYTNGGEIAEYFLRTPPWVYGLYVVLVAVWVLCLVLSKPKYFDWSKRLWVRVLMLVMIVVFSLTTVIRYALTQHPIYFDDLRLTEITLPEYVYTGFKKLTEDDKKRSVFDRSTSWEITKLPEGPQCDVCVFVMGESVSRQFMGAYGAPWNNTPWMSMAPGVLFRNMNSSANTTAPSLGVSLYAFEPNGRAPWGDNIITLAKKLGYYTAWYSNQGRTDVHDSPVSQVASFSNESVFIREGLPKTIAGYSDFDLLELVEKALKRKGKLFIVVHLVGSHPAACLRTNGEYDDYFLSKDLSCYIKSIKNTDLLLSKIADLEKKEAGARSWGLMYTSDHGVTIIHGIDGLAVSHGADQESFEVPFFITGSQYHDRSELTSQRSARYLSYMVGSWLGVNVKGKLPAVQCSWLKDETCEDQDKVRIGYKPFRELTTLRSLKIHDLHN